MQTEKQTNKQTVYFNPYIYAKATKKLLKSRKKINVNFSVMWPVFFIGKYLPQFFLCLIAGECHRSVNISTCWGYIPQDWRINAFACPRGGAGEASVLNSVHYMSRLHIFFLIKADCIHYNQAVWRWVRIPDVNNIFSLSYLVKFALYISLHAMWMYCNIRLGWRLRFNVNNSAYILCIMGLTSLFVQTIRHWQSFHISHRNAF